MSVDLNNIKIGFSPLSGELFIYRHGKDVTLALDKRLAHEDVMTALVQYMMDDAPKGAEQNVKVGGKWYTVTVKRGRK